MFRSTLDAVASVPDAKLRWIGFSHFQFDECGALNEWLKIAPEAQAVCSVVGARVTVDHAKCWLPAVIACASWPRIMCPIVWDAGLFFEDEQRTLLCSDLSDLLFIPGDPAPLTGADILDRARSDRAEPNRPLGQRHAVHTLLERHSAAACRPQTPNARVMHGSSFQGDGEAILTGLAQVVRETLGGRAGD